ncbi:MAG: cardiolipin synthase [Lachnospiraceae bacterium]|nr:cardiolipin synthase [Lachnospiraceae bacterium]
MLNLFTKKWFRQIFRRRVLIICMLMIQIGFLAYVIISGSLFSKHFSTLLTLLSIFVALYVVSKREKGAFKLTWVFLILLFPLFGGLMYILFNFQTSTKRFSNRIELINERTQHYYFLPGNHYEEARLNIPQHTSQIRYLQQFAGFPIHKNSSTRYLSPGEKKFELLKTELEKAEKYIFLEYFIIQEGIMWDEILEILQRKVKEGVLVRVIYDDMGCFLVLPPRFPEKLKSYGIECAVFNPFKPLLTVMQNNRDHRKIAVIDGKVAFTGGINLADEYINAVVKFGHWKDASVMITGDAAWSFTVMFLQMWELCKNTQEDYSIYFPTKDDPCPLTEAGYVQPYTDSPMDSENVGEHVYLQILNNAKDYVYIYTPYLIIDDSIISALTLAAKSGVDIRIITPHKWDKWIIHMTTRSYYRELIKSGVKIYEYSKGFLHAKTFVSDDNTATVGTTNLDFRSLYLHFECGVWMYGTSSVTELKEDFLQTQKECVQIELKDCTPKLPMRFFQDILRLLAPLM